MAMDCNESMVTVLYSIAPNPTPTQLFSIIRPRLRRIKLTPKHRADVTPAPILRPASIARNPGLKFDTNRENS
ncbi:hypothetical protein R3P38DRAFT_3287875 [Favolaschia claudopus]|uniref:Uncharacterized protein n=1 Tax=Favolaschia claudopus TaxID=2862362 RepID=A0AAV9ZZR0_9AGAR